MLPDDEILFGRVRDSIDSSYERAASLATLDIQPAVPGELALALALFELHGATLRALGRWYPDEACVGDALFTWELYSVRLKSKGLTVATFVHSRPNGSEAVVADS